MSTLTDRYISEVVRHLPEDQRGDISTEIATTIDDMVAAELEAGTAAGPGPDPTAAEHAVLTRLGDPAALADRYSGARRYLVGPDVYPVWARVLRWILPVVGTIAALAGGILYVATTPEPEIGGLIGQLVSSVAAAVLWAFAAWTLVVVIIERTTPDGARSPLAPARARPWDPADLDDPDAGSGTRTDAVVSLVMLAILAVVPFLPSTFFYIGHLNGGERLIDPGIPTVWVTGYLLFIGLLALIQVWRLARPRQTGIRVGLEVAVDVVFGGFLTAFILGRSSILHPDLVAAGDDSTVAAVIRWGLVAAVWLIVVWDQVETLRAYRGAGAAPS